MCRITIRWQGAHHFFVPLSRYVRRSQAFCLLRLDTSKLKTAIWKTRPGGRFLQLLHDPKCWFLVVSGHLPSVYMSCYDIM
jgi:hypothetical protein